MHSPYAKGLFLVQKRDGRLLVCMDYQGNTKNTTPDHYPIPRIDELLDIVGKKKGKIFTSLGLMKGYVAQSDKPKMVFMYHQRLFQFQRMPFDLTNALAFKD